MSTDYTPWITAMVVITVLLTAMVTYVLSRPSDLSQKAR